MSVKINASASAGVNVGEGPARAVGGRTPHGGGLREDERAWRDQMLLATKLVAFREALPPGQRAILDGIMQRAQLAAAAGLTDVTGYGQGEGEGEGLEPARLLAVAVDVLRDYQARLDAPA